MLLYQAHSYLDGPGGSVSITVYDFYSTFNPIQPHIFKDMVSGVEEVQDQGDGH